MLRFLENFGTFKKGKIWRVERIFLGLERGEYKSKKEIRKNWMHAEVWKLEC